MTYEVLCQRLEGVLPAALMRPARCSPADAADWTIKSLPAAFRMMKAMQAEGIEWGEDDRQGARDAVAELLRGRMDPLLDEHLERMAELGLADRRNGC